VFYALLGAGLCKNGTDPAGYNTLSVDVCLVPSADTWHHMPTYISKCNGLVGEMSD